MQFILDSFVGAFALIVGLDPEVYFIIWTSLKVSFAAVFLATVTGTPLGLLIAVNEFAGKHALQVVLNTLMALPTVVVGLLFYGFLSRQGPLGNLDSLFTPEGMTLGLFVLALPIVVNLTVSAIQSMDSRLFITCKTLGAGTAQQAWMIMREARFAVMAAVVMAFGRVISEVGIAMMLGGNIKGFTRTMTTAIALETSKGEFVLGVALGIVLLCVAFGINGALYVLQRMRA